MTLRSDDLLRFQIRLRQERDALLRDLRRLDARRAALFQEGAREVSERLRVAAARRVRGVEMQIRGLRQTLSLLDRQGQLLGHLIFAQENRDRLDRPPFTITDWGEVFSLVAQTADALRAREQQVEALLAALEGPRPAGRPTEPPGRPGSVPGAERRKPPLAGEVVRAVSVPDGDGLTLEDGRKVRYIGVDTPEMRTWENGPQPFAREATQFNRGLVEGKLVRLVKDTSDTDRYGRLLRFVYAGEVCVNEALLRAGMARVLTVKPNCARAEAFETLEAQARKRGVGIWKAGQR